MTGDYRVGYAPEALTDLRNTYVYIARVLKAPETARRFTERIRREIRSLDTLPARFPAVDWAPWDSMGVRRFNVENFAVFYQVDAAKMTVTVIRILYGGRDFQRIAEIGE